jgi:hypothetical protein
MVSISAQTNADDLQRRLNNAIARQMPFATALALTETAKDIRTSIQGKMPRVFDRPTPFTLNAFQVVPATKVNQVAMVEYKHQGKRHYLATQVLGGQRRRAAFENRIGNIFDDDLVAFAGDTFGAIIPARGAQRDQYGNWSSGERNRVLSALQVQMDPTANTTDASRRRNSRRAEYYIGRRGRVRGVFKTQGGEDTLILLFVKPVPTYQPRLPLDQIAERTFQTVYRANFNVALERALATAR